MFTFKGEENVIFPEKYFFANVNSNHLTLMLNSCWIYTCIKCQKYKISKTHNRLLIK